MSNLRKSLSSGKTVFVRFEKANGEIRNMICTQNASLIPSTMRSSGRMQYDRSQIRVFDIVAQEWRSMIESRVLEFSEYTAQVA
jgi:hypothetical protein